MKVLNETNNRIDYKIKDFFPYFIFLHLVCGKRECTVHSAHTNNTKYERKKVKHMTINLNEKTENVARAAKIAKKSFLYFYERKTNHEKSVNNMPLFMLYEASFVEISKRLMQINKNTHKHSTFARTFFFSCNSSFSVSAFF